MTHDALWVMLRASLEGGALLLFLWAITRLWPTMPAAARRTLWWLGCLRMILGLLPLPAFRISMPSPWERATAVLPAPVTSLGWAASQAVATLPTATPTRIDLFSIILLGVWLAGVLAATWLMVARILQLRRRWARARSVETERLAAWGLSNPGLSPRHFEVRTSEEIDGPVTIGVLRPRILLPAGSTGLSDEALRLVLAHEMSHIRRFDGLLGWIPAIAELLFWFHPLVHLAAREFLMAREEVCDADALRLTGASPRIYGGLLLEFGVRRLSALPGAAACGSAEGRHLRRRLQMLSSTLSPTRHRVGATLLMIVFLLLGFAPVRWVGAYESSSTPKAGTPAGGKRERTPVAYLLWNQGEKMSRGAIDEADMDAARGLQSPKDSDLLYFRFGDQAYVTQDAETIAQVRKALEPQDRYERERRPSNQRREELNHQYTQLTRTYERLRDRGQGLRERARDLEKRRTALVEEGRSTRELNAERDQLDEDRARLQREQQQIEDQLESLNDELQKIYADEKKSWTERDRIHEEELREISRIGRRAIEEGRAERFPS